MAAAPLSTSETTRYSRHLLLPEVGLAGQQRLKRARVLVVGAGGLGSPVIAYLAAAGVGTLGIVDADVVDVSNLQRQVIHPEQSVGRSKVSSAAEAVARANPNVVVETHEVLLDSSNAAQIVGRYDLVVDGTDNFPTRYLVNDACVMAGLPLVWASILRFDGQVAVWWAGHGPCYRCVFPEPPPPGSVPSCAEGGVLGAMCGTVGAVQATEALKLVLGIGEPLVGRLLVHDALRQSWDTLRVEADPDCPVCGTDPQVTELADYAQLCGIAPESQTAARADTEVSVRELARLRSTDPTVMLVDVRSEAERAIATIPGSRHVPLEQFRTGTAWEQLPRDVPVLVHCKTGGRSSEAVQLATAAGFANVRNVAGGIVAYTREIDPTLPEY